MKSIKLLAIFITALFFSFSAYDGTTDLGAGAHNQDIGNGFIHTENYKSYIDLAKKSLR